MNFEVGLVRIPIQPNLTASQSALALGGCQSLSKVVRLQEGSKNIIEASESMAKKLSNLGWRLTLYEGGSKILTMRGGASRLTGPIRANPLKLRKLLKALR